jgi:hypothetical protein
MMPSLLGMVCLRAQFQFLVYINDFFLLRPEGPAVQLYADNVVIMYSNKDLFQIYNKMEQDLRKLNDWFHHNQLTVNPNKTSYMIFRNPHKDVYKRYTFGWSAH